MHCFCELVLNLHHRFFLFRLKSHWATYHQPSYLIYRIANSVFFIAVGSNFTFLNQEPIEYDFFFFCLHYFILLVEWLHFTFLRAGLSMFICVVCIVYLSASCLLFIAFYCHIELKTFHHICQRCGCMGACVYLCICVCMFIKHCLISVSSKGKSNKLMIQEKEREQKWHQMEM